MSEKKLFLLDAMALLYRAHFAFIRAPRITSKGVNTSALFGFTNSLIQIIEKDRPTHLAVAFDHKGPTFRHKQFPEYKANREEVPEDVAQAIPLAKELLRALNIPVLEIQEYEADDLIGTLAKRAESHGYDVYMVTPDKDFAQLVSDHVFLYKPARAGNGAEILDPKLVEEKFGVPPERIIDFLGLKGDSVDNIPGIPRIGDKTAVELIRQFGTVEEIIERSDEITKKAVQASVKEHAQQGILSKELATIVTDVPVEWSEDDLRIGDPDRERTLEMMRELEFRNTAERLLSTRIFAGDRPVQTDLFGNAIGDGGDSGISQELMDSIESQQHSYKWLKTEDEVRDLVARIRKEGSFCFDTETTGLDAMQAELIAITVSLKAGEAFMIHFPENDPEAQKLLTIFREVLEDEKIEKIGQNLKYDMLVLLNAGVEVCGPLYDTMLAHYVLHPDQSHGMDNMSRDLLNYNPVSITELIGKKGKKQLSMRDVPVDKLCDYACEDADITLRLRDILAPQVKEHGVDKVLETVELPLVPVLTQMEYTGVAIDEGFLNGYSKELEVLLQQTEKNIYGLAGAEFNINSPRQLGDIIFDKLKLAKGKKTKTGQYSTREEILVELAHDHDLPAQVLYFRKLGKLKSTYVDALPQLINPRTGRIHTTFSQAVAATGRLSSNHPNLQNIPIRTDEGREVRKAFIATEGYELMAADYSQVELRIIAELSGDPAMIHDFMDGHDIHRATAARVFGVSHNLVDADMRSKAKMVNFGIIYGISAFGLAQRLKIDRREAKDIIDAYFEKYPHIKAYMDEKIEFARKHGYAETVMGRKRPLPDINSKNQTVRGFAERNAINMPVQGTAADLIKVAMIHIHDEMKRRGLKSRMTLQVHDELVFEIVANEKEEMTTLVKNKMEHAVKFKVPMLVETGFGQNWLQAH